MSTSIPFQLFLDPSGRLLDRLGVRRQSLVRYVFNIAAWLRWLRALVTNRRQYRITGHYSDVPAVAVVSPGGQVTYVYRATGLGDYPDLDEVLAAVDAVRGE